jgi:hypothetical protein
MVKDNKVWVPLEQLFAAKLKKFKHPKPALYTVRRLLFEAPYRYLDGRGVQHENDLEDFFLTANIDPEIGSATAIAPDVYRNDFERDHGPRREVYAIELQISVQPTVEPFRTGSAGRPTAKEIIIAEFKRRIETGEVTPYRHGGLKEEGERLFHWWEKERQTHTPPGPEVTVGTIENQIRASWRALAAQTKPTK